MNTTVFRASIAAWEKSAAADLEALARQVCFEVAERVIDRTPVDVGNLRGSWQPSIGEPAAPQPMNDPAGAQVMQAVIAAVAGIKLGDTFYLLNHTAYGPHVEFGTSKMKGRFFVTDTAAEFPAIANDMATQLGMTK